MLPFSDYVSSSPPPPLGLKSTHDRFEFCIGLFPAEIGRTPQEEGLKTLWWWRATFLSPFSGCKLYELMGFEIVMRENDPWICFEKLDQVATVILNDKLEYVWVCWPKKSSYLSMKVSLVSFFLYFKGLNC